MHVEFRVFAEVANPSSMIRAAANLHLTRSAVSMQVKEVEAQARPALFERHGRQVSLSTAGE
jgi:LysR family transcriptional activator of nhaA